VATLAPDLDRPAPQAWTADQDTAFRLWIVLSRCYGTYAKAVATKVQDYGLTASQFSTLEVLYHLGPLTLGELADKLFVTRGNVTYLMDRLVSQGLVYRHRCPDDQRVIQAKLTDDGRALVARVFPGHVEYIEHLSRHLDEDEQESLQGLLRCLGEGIAGSDL